MKTAIYIVINSRDAWYVDLDGESNGPFTTIDAAIQNAIELAAATSRRGGRSEVRVMGPGHSALVYQSTERSLLSRAAASLALSATAA
ncbi:MAG TPA: hypothetical protein GYA10_14020 [Alphaproteobacteria bacterium]|nr:hypothetical protein [Alphaproteobacteria bacterium]